MYQSHMYWSVVQRTILGGGGGLEKQTVFKNPKGKGQYSPKIKNLFFQDQNTAESILCTYNQ